jgi:hypothetical protein
MDEDTRREFQRLGEKQAEGFARLGEAVEGITRDLHQHHERAGKHAERIRALEFWRYGLVTGWAMLAGAGVALWTFMRGS